MFTTKRLPEEAEREFRSILIHGFTESGILVRDVAWYRYEFMLAYNMKYAALDDVLSEAEEDGHFEPIKLDMLREFILFFIMLQIGWLIIFAFLYSIRYFIDHMKSREEKEMFSYENSFKHNSKKFSQYNKSACDRPISIHFSWQ